MSSRGRKKKSRSQRTYDIKCTKLEAQWIRCPKIQKKFTLEQWLSQVKQPTK